MMRFELVPHPNHPPLAVRGIAVELSGGSDDLSLTYRIDGAAQVVWPEWSSPARTDDLWRTTCFELFLMLDDNERYVEFNFSPSTQWAAYAFDGYREGMADLPMMQAPEILSLPDRLEVAVGRADLPHGEPRMALTAVIEEAGGVKSYWSLAHPPGAPDFHHAGCFVARLPAPESA